MRPLRTARKLTAEHSCSYGVLSLARWQASLRAGWTNCHRPASTLSSTQSIRPHAFHAGEELLLDDANQTELLTRTNITTSRTPHRSTGQGIPRWKIPHDYFRPSAADDSSTGSSFFRRVVATAEEEANLKIDHKDQRLASRWASKISAQLDQTLATEGEEEEDIGNSFEDGGEVWTLSGTNDEARDSKSSPGFGVDIVWAMRLQAQLHPSMRSEGQRTQKRRLLTREERRDVLELSSGIREALDFANIIKQEPWTEQDLKLGNSERRHKQSNESRVAEVPGLEADIFAIKEQLDKDDEQIDKVDEDEVQQSNRLFSFTTGRPWSSTAILAGFIDLTTRKPVLSGEHYDKLLLDLFSDQALSFLEARGGYTIEEVIAWAWILQAESNHIAVMRLLVWTNRPLPAKRVPRVVMYLLLQHRWLKPATIRLLTMHLKHRIENTLDPKWAAVYARFVANASQATISTKVEKLEHERGRYRQLEIWRRAVSILILMKNAATVATILLPSLASMLCQYVYLLGTRIDGMERILTQHGHMGLNKIFNKAIELVARNSVDPFLNVAYQERAQFILIRHMNTFRPTLTLSLGAYRAITSIQLRHRKTVKERLWAELKSRAWPPYREDKLGIDALKKQEDYGISRAQRAIMNMKDAGHGPTDWEDSASVLSGWDINRSPTIQSRRLFLDRAQPRNLAVSNAAHVSIWHTRILSTRTIEEAWAIFLEYIREDVSKHTSVFRAMFEKIIFERQRILTLERELNVSTSSVLAGDALETMASSRNPREQTYVAIPPPDFESFFQRYLTYFPELDSETLCFLLPHVESLAQAYELVEKSDLTANQKGLLLRNTEIDVGGIPAISRILSAYVRMLSNFAPDPLPNWPKVSALSHALKLVILWNPKGTSPWLSMLQAIARDIEETSPKKFWHQQWSTVLNILDRMEKRRVTADNAVFHTLCSIFVRLIRSASTTSPRGQHHQYTSKPGSASEMRYRANKLMKRLFKQMVTLDLRAVFSHTEDEMPYLPLSKHEDSSGPNERIEFDIAKLLPHILYTPSPAALHLFIHFLAMTEDRKAIFDLVRWMAMYHQELGVRTVALASGAKQFRYALIAIRVAMESSIIPFMSAQLSLKLDATDRPFAKETKRVVESVPNWHGWPSDREVNDYMKMWVHFPAIDDSAQYGKEEHMDM